MFDSLSDAIASIEAERKSIEVYTTAPQEAADVADQFSTKNVAVDYSPLPDEADEGFVIIRGPDGAFLGSIGLSTFAAILAPEIHPPWTLVESDTEYDQIFDFLDNTLFSSFNRRQMLATAREIEERAWRHAAGRLYTGFQTVEAYQAQESVYERLNQHEQVSVQLYLNADWETEVSDLLPVQLVSTDEIGEFWFVFYDGGGSDLAKCGLLAEERRSRQYYGFWTYDPAYVDELILYLESRFGISE
jgi:hypothetical protein